MYLLTYQTLAHMGWDPRQSTVSKRERVSALLHKLSLTPTKDIKKKKNRPKNKNQLTKQPEEADTFTPRMLTLPARSMRQSLFSSDCRKNRLGLHDRNSLAPSSWAADVSFVSRSKKLRTTLTKCPGFQNIYFVQKFFICFILFLFSKFCLSRVP